MSCTQSTWGGGLRAMASDSKGWSYENWYSISSDRVHRCSRFSGLVHSWRLCDPWGLMQSYHDFWLAAGQAIPL